MKLEEKVTLFSRPQRATISFVNTSKSIILELFDSFSYYDYFCYHQQVQRKRAF